MNNTDQVIEIVTYRVKADQVSTYAHLAEITNTFLHNQPGFIRRQTLQDHQEGALFTDIVTWRTLEDAQTATQASQQEASLVPFFEATEEVVTFGHYRPFQP